MLALLSTLFVAGLLTILLPCILPLIPIVLGVSIADRNKWRPLVTIAGMLASFVGFTFLLQVLLRQFVELADVVRIATFYVLLLFGLGFLFQRRTPQLVGAALGSLFFWDKGWLAIVLVALLGTAAMEVGGRVAAILQQFGADVQARARAGFGAGSLLTAFIVGLTMGLVWVPCAGPALGLALSLVRDQPGLRALLALSTYGAGAGLPLLLIGYGGQAAVHSVRFLGRYSGRIKEASGVLLILSALGFRYNVFQDLQVWFVEHTTYGTLGTQIEESLFSDQLDRTPSSVPSPSASSERQAVSSSLPSSRRAGEASSQRTSASPPSSIHTMVLPTLPKLIRAPEFTGLGPWHNSAPLTLAGLKGKVVLVDFWTYSCINCIRTLPYIEGYWEKFKDKPFVLIGVHTPEFVFEKSPENVAAAIKRHGLTYPVAQDNDYGTWEAFGNHYWPAKYLIDANGYIRYTHFGEGAYDETDLAIQSLLKEAGAAVTGEVTESMPATRRGSISPETYLGARSWPSLGNSAGGPTGDTVHYDAPSTMMLHKYYLAGDWRLVDGEYQLLESDTGEIRMRFQGGEINLVLGLHPGAAPVQGDVLIDGTHVETITVDRHDLFNLFKGEYGEHEMILKFHGRGVEGYAFTFG